MNAFGFFIGRFAWQLGLTRERARWTAVTRETQQLAETQDLLGKLAWPGTDSIERLSGDFWQITGLHQQQQALSQQSDTLISENDQAQDRLYAIEDEMEDQIDIIRKKKAELLGKAVSIMDGVDEVKDRDGETRRRFTSMKGKLEVLKKQEGGEYEAEIEKTRQMLAQLKEEHTRDLAVIAQLEAEVQQLELVVQGIDAEIAGLRERTKAETADLVREIGLRSKQIAELSARKGTLEAHKNELSFQIGQYLSNQIDGNDPAVRQVLSRFGPLVNRIRYLRRSIQYNQRLARRASR